MPKVVAHAIIWLVEQDSYARCEPGSPDFKPIPDEQGEWLSWLAACSSFAFRGKQGHLTLRKESRARREDYWYAYRCQNRRTIKRYAGRTIDLAITHLEEIAGKISAAFAVPHTLRAAPTSASELAPHAAISPFLTHKLSLPRLQRALVERERLLVQLDACLELPLTLLCAPAGFGKTTLVRQWIATRNEQALFPRIAWISLDAGDNDPTRFWRSILTAAQAWYVAPDQRILNLLRSSSQPCIESLTLEVVLTTFLNEVVRQNISGLLILEDYHSISETRIHETLSFFLTHLPETLHVVLITRHEPPLLLARLRANGDLNEIRAAELRFSLAESATFLQAFLLSPEALEHLDTYLEGWAAGLRLLSLSLQGKATQPQVERALATFSGSHRPILDYFVTEVLQTQPEAIQSFLLRTSVLPRLTPSLCVAVTGWQESALLLEQIERDNLFLEELDEEGEWYRYHALFAEAMQYEARRRLGEDELCTLSHLASRWFEQQGLLPEAIEAALKARESARAASLMEQFFHSPQIQETHEYHTLRRWLEQLPAALLQQSPILCFGYAIALTFDRKAHEATPVSSDQLEALLQRAEAGWRASNDLPRLGAGYAFRATTALQQGKLETAATWGQQALALLPEAEVMWRSTSLSALAFRALQEGAFNEARRLFQQVDSLAQGKSNAPFRGMATLFLGIISFEQGQLHQAAGYYHKLSQHGEKQEAYPASIIATLPMTLILYEWNELATLQQQTQRVFELAEQFSAIPQSIIHMAIEIPLACLQHAQGETRLAVQRLSTLWAERRLDENNFPSYLYLEALHWLIRFSLLLGDQPGAQHWLNELTRCHWQYQAHVEDAPQLQAPVNPSALEIEQSGNVLHAPRNIHIPAHLQEQKMLLMARLALLQGEPEDALTLLCTLLPEAQRAKRGRNLLQIKLLMAQAHAARKQSSQARQWLLEALEQGYPEGYQRSFLDEGERLVPLLRELLPHLRPEPLRDYAQTLLRSFSSTQHGQDRAAVPGAEMLVDPLSPQEQRVLRLLVAGRSNAEIARELVVSVNTIRTQIQSIYRKLQVNNRHAASKIAHQLRIG